MHILQLGVEFLHVVKCLGGFLDLSVYLVEPAVDSSHYCQSNIVEEGYDD